MNEAKIMGNDHRNGNVTHNEMQTEQAPRTSESSHRWPIEAAYAFHTLATASPRQSPTSRRSAVMIIDRRCKDFRHTSKPSGSRISNQQLSGCIARLWATKQGENHDSGIISALRSWFPKSFGFCKPDFAGEMKRAGTES